MHGLFKDKKLITNFLIFLLFIIGFFLSLKTGISHDEFHEQLNWEKNFNLIKSIGQNDFEKNYNELKNYNDKYHGIGFHYISQFFQFILSDFIKNFFNIDLDGAIYLSKHPIIFAIFFLSAFFFRKILKLAIKDRVFLNLSFLFYLFYPYLLGHALINPKDIPFLSVWLCLSYYNFILLKNIFIDDVIKKNKLILFVFLFAFLISIRLSGILFFLQFLITFFLFYETSQKNIFEIFYKNLRILILSFLFFLFLIYLFIPISWLNFFEIFNGIKWLSKYHNNVKTLTNGNYVEALNVPVDYIFNWMLVKLPFVCLFGLVIYFFNFNKIDKNLNCRIIINSFLLTFLVIYFLLYFRSTSLYDEVRHLLFIFPLLLISSLLSIYYFKREICYLLLIFSISIFSYENIKIFPYQYSWFNIPSRFFDISKNYEIDYWATANRELSEHLITKYSDQNNICIYGSQYDYIFLKKYNFSCFKNFTSFKNDKRKSFVLQYGRNLRDKYKLNNSCNLLHQKSYKLLFTKQEFVIGKIFLCS